MSYIFKCPSCKRQRFFQDKVIRICYTCQEEMIKLEEISQHEAS